jgi:molecular chaperone GrpE
MSEPKEDLKNEKPINEGEEKKLKNEKDSPQTEEEQHKEDHKKDHKKKKFETENERLQKMTKEELVVEYDKLLADNERLQKFAGEKEKESTEYLDRYRRSLAEVENVRRRLAAEKTDILKYANFNIVSDLLVILDDFQRAIENANAENVDFDNFKKGVELIENQFVDLLFKKYAVVKFGEKGEDFDPNKHQAVMMEDGDSDTETLAEVFRSGYSLHDRVIRPAQVKITKAKN